MAGRIRKEDIDLLRERADIAAVVGDYTQLKRAGSRLKGLCPFHQEKSPSFTVDPTSNLYHCFGCGEGGDIFSFLMAIEALEFTEAVEQLARRSGITLHYEELSSGQKRALGERSRWVAVTAAAQAFFREQLYGDTGTVARDYLKSRGFGREEAEHFEVGFAPNEWEALSRHLHAQHIPADDVVKVGLAVRNDRGGLRDRFRGRLIFPVHDVSGDVIGFGGRVLPGLDYGDFDPPKYYNSPETPLYRKTKVLYGLHQARAEIVRSESVLICEGYTDVMALHQAGFSNAVATCGTAVTGDHLAMLTRYARRVVLAFDADEAGAGAAERAWGLSREHDLDVRVLVLPPGRDPADVVGEEGAEGLAGRVADAERVVPFVLRRRVAEQDLATDEGKVAALDAALKLLGEVEDITLRRQYARAEVAEALGWSMQIVERAAGRLGIALDAHDGVAIGAPAAGGERGRIATTTDPGRARMERQVLRTALQNPDLLPDQWFELTEDDFSHPRARAVWRALVAAGGAGVEIAHVIEVAEDDSVRSLVREIALEDLPFEPDAATEAWRVRQLAVSGVETDMAALNAELERTNMTTDRDRGLALMTRLSELEKTRRLLRAGDD